MAGTVAPNMVTDGLVLYLDAANTKSYPGSGTTWTDLVSSKNAILNNGPSFNPSNGGSITFDLVDDNVSFIPSNPTNNITDELTAEIFFQPTDLTTTFNAIYILTTNATFRLYRNAPGTSPGTLTWLIYYYDTSNILRVLTDYNTYNLNEWSSTSVSVYSNGTVRFFINGQFVDSRAPSNFNYWDITPRISNPTITMRYVNIASFKLYNTSLSDSEIQQNYNATKTRFGL
jgi:hypothetical protein